jgi:hypothetical protein
MAREKPEVILKRAEKARQEIDSNRGMFEDAYEYLMPWRNTFSGKQASHRKTTKQYDSTGMIAANNFVNTMLSNFTPPFQVWSMIKSGPSIPEEQRPGNDKILQKIDAVIDGYRNASNFYTAVAEGYFDLGIGTMVMFILKGTPERPFNYVVAPLSQVAIEDGKYGEVCGAYRTHKCKGRIIKSLWPKAKLTANLEKAIKDKPDEEIEFTEAFYYDYDEFRWYQDVIYAAEKESIYKDEFAEAPFVAPRWMKIPGFATGIGPFVMAMADYKTLNKMKELMLMLAALNVFGVYTVASSGTFNPNTAQIKPAAFIPVERNGTQNPSIAPLPRAGDFQIQEYMLQDLKDQIKQVMLDNRLPDETAPVKTAYEIAQRVKKEQLNIGAAFGRLMYEFVIPLRRREIAIAKEMNLIQVPEDFQIDTFFTQVQVVSPIAQAQATADVQKLVEAFQITAGISPELALLSFDVERIGKWVGDKLNVDATLIRSDEDRQALQKAVAGMVAQAQMAQQQQQAVA